MQTIIDNFQHKQNRIFAEFTLATACTIAGLELISANDLTKTVSINLGEDIFTEPVSFKELFDSSKDIHSSNVYLYQNMMIACWFDLISEIFKYFVEQHFDGIRIFSELKKQNLKIDFSSNVNIENQVKECLINDFSFRRYSDRFKIINGILNSENEYENETKNINKHVLIRNAIQHHNGITYIDMFTQLGVLEISLLDQDGLPQNILVGDKVYIYAPELDLLKRYLHLISQKWRNVNA